MTDVFLGVIAVSVLVMALLQVAAAVWAARTARRVDDVMARLERDLQPIVQSLQALSADAARAAATAAVQVDRADQMLVVVRERLDEALRVVQEALVRPARDLVVMLQSLRDVFRRGVPQGPRRYPSRKRQTEEEDALFIG